MLVLGIIIIVLAVLLIAVMLIDSIIYVESEVNDYDGDKVH